MASYTVRVGGTGTKVQSEGADPVANPELCMPLATALGESYSPGDVLLFADTGGEYRATLYTPSEGADGVYFYQKAYPGHSPVFNGSNVTTGWTAHATLPNVWQKTGITKEPSMIWFDDERGGKKDNAASLAAEMDWCWVSNVAYVYTLNASGPEVEYAEVELAARQYCQENNANPYVYTDGLEYKHSNWLSVYVTQGSDFSKFYNCHAHHSMVGFKCADDDCVFDSCISEWHTGDGFAGSGSVDPNSKCNRLLINLCISRENMYIEGVNGGSGTGIKSFGMRYSTLTKTIWNDNDQGGIRLDGGGIIGVEWPEPNAYWGCEYNTVSENLCFNNGGVGGVDGDPSQVDQIMMEFSDFNTVKFNIVYDCVDGGYNIGVSRSGSCKFIGNITWGATGTSVGSIRTYFGAGGPGRTNYFVGNIIDDSYWAFSFNGNGYEYLRNNIMFNCLSYCLRWGDADAAVGYDGDYNCFHRYNDPQNTADIVKVFPVAYDFGEWKALGHDLNSIQADPLFTDPDNHDYTLQSGSPCRGAGDKSIGPPYNEALHPDSDITTAGGMIIVDRDDF